jgi:osmotically-inducible protein OsmY
MRDEELALDVRDELFWDPRIDGRAIAVTAVAGVVTLRGTVGSFRQRQEAKRAAHRIRGVLAVNDQLEVQIMSDQRQEDADLRGDVLDALTLDVSVPTSVDATVKDGVVTLTGPVDWQYQREEAEFIAGNLPGVAGVDNQIWLHTVRPGAVDMEHEINKALTRNAWLDADAVHVSTSSGTVTLSGRVRCWEEHDAAIATAWAAPGVEAVRDRLTVAY